MTKSGQGKSVLFFIVAITTLYLLAMGQMNTFFKQISMSVYVAKTYFSLKLSSWLLLIKEMGKDNFMSVSFSVCDTVNDL